LLGPVAVHEDVDLVLGDHDDLVVEAGLHVDDVPPLLALGHGVHSLLDGLELAAAVLGHHRVRLRLVARRQELSLRRPHPHWPAFFVLLRQEPATRVLLEHAEVQLLQDPAEAVGDSERVAAELGGVAQHGVHVGLELLVDKAVDAGVHERHDAREPCLEVVGPADKHLDVAAGHLEHAPEVVNGVLEELLAVLSRALGHGVAGLSLADRLGLLDRCFHRLQRHLGNTVEHLLGVLGAIGGLGERLLTRLLVQRGRAQGLDRLAGRGNGGFPRDGEVVAGLLARVGDGGDHADDHRDDDDRPQAT
jgi:hypothetical protein